jgi:coenzyme Q-binding protein COQ10
MPEINYSLESQYPSEYLFDLVSDIESYSLFLPWVAASRIISQQEDNIIMAELLIKYKIFRSSYISKVTLIPKQEIIVDLVDGPFEYLQNHWKFYNSKIDFHLKFKLKSSFLEKIINSELELYGNKLIHSFIKRADELYK